jgi:hypothetical protein
MASMLCPLVSGYPRQDLGRDPIGLRAAALSLCHTRTVTVPLIAGSNTIRAVAATANGGPNVDFLDLNR